jgi:hypothetical protein
LAFFKIRSIVHLSFFPKEMLAASAPNGSARRIIAEDITVGEWVKKFTAIETSPRTGHNASKNRPYSLDTLKTIITNAI